MPGPKNRTRRQPSSRTNPVNATPTRADITPTAWPGQAVGVISALVGVALTGLVLDEGWRRVRFFGPGIVFALVASVGFAINVTGLSTLVSNEGWLQGLIL